jgi:heme/copper-type cytochrome/quinol oxidase subunit 2
MFGPIAAFLWTPVHAAVSGYLFVALCMSLCLILVLKNDEEEQFSHHKYVIAVGISLLWLPIFIVSVLAVTISTITDKLAGRKTP